MKAVLSNILDLLGKEKVTFSVPVFQRVYSWSKDDCRYLFDDINNSADKDHFVGALLYYPHNNESTVLEIIDGQQRVTSVSLALIALMLYMKEMGKTLDNGMTYADIAKKYLFGGANQNHVKLSLTSIDKEMYDYLLGASMAPADISSRLQENLNYFKSRMSSPNFDLNKFWKGLNHLSIIDIALDENDEPQEVFESLNSKGKKLNIEDILRNETVRQIKINQDYTNLFESLWMPMEDAVDDLFDVTLNDMIYCWLASKNSRKQIKSENDIYKLFMNNHDIKNIDGLRACLTELNNYCNVFSKDENMRNEALKVMNKWKSGKPLGRVSDYKIFGD